MRILCQGRNRLMPVEGLLPSPKLSFGPSPYNLSQKRLLMNTLICHIYSSWKLKKNKTFSYKEYRIYGKSTRFRIKRIGFKSYPLLEAIFFFFLTVSPSAQQ